MFQVRTHFARPNWKEVFTRIASKHPNSTVGNILPQCIIFFSQHTERHEKTIEHRSSVNILIMRAYIMHAGVFYCGRPTLAKELKKLSLDMSHKTGTRFDFHKEYF
jgi:respiratory burst oxidase